MKRKIAGFLAAALFLLLSGCGAAGNQSDSTASRQETAQAEIETAQADGKESTQGEKTAREMHWLLLSAAWEIRRFRRMRMRFRVQAFCGRTGNERATHRLWENGLLRRRAAGCSRLSQRHPTPQTT